MPSQTTVTLGGSISFAQAFIGYRSLAVGTSSEPAVTAANIIMQTILSPPFTWNWNRSSVNFLTTIGVQDYSTAVSNFGFLEKGSYIPGATITNTVLNSGVATYTAVNSFSKGDNVTVTGLTNNPTVFNITNQPIASANATSFTVNITHADISSGADSGTATAGKRTEIPGVMRIIGGASDADNGTPNNISAQTDDNNGNISFRLLPVPDNIYQVTVEYQKRIPALISSTSSTWAPIPDHYSYIYQLGFTALMMAYAGDARWMQFNQKFVGELLGVAQGLSDEQKNIFMAGWLNMVTEQQTMSLKSQQGVQGRGV